MHVRLLGSLLLLPTTIAYGKQPVSKPQESFAPYWTSEPGWQTELRLKNNLASTPLTVTPVLRLASGREVPLTPVTIPANDSTSVWVNLGLLEHAPELLSQAGSFGSVVFRYTSFHAQNLRADAVISIQGQPISVAVPARPLTQITQTDLHMTHQPTSLEGIWWDPRSGLNDVLVISNSSNQEVSGTVSLFDASGRQWSEALNLDAHQTERIATGDLLRQAGLSSAYGGVSVRFSSMSAIDAFHFMYDESTHFSASLELSSRDARATLAERAGKDATQWTLRAPMLALRRPDPALSLPARTLLQPTIFVRNTTAANISATGTLDWRGPSGRGQVKLPELQLAPYATQQLQIGAMQTLLRIPDNAHWAMVSLTTNSAPDDVIAIASSRDASGRYGIEAKFVGGRGGQYAGSEWRADVNHNAIAVFTNVGGKPTDALLTLHYDGGQKSYELQRTIAPGDQMWVNLAGLIRNRVPDRNGNTLPVDVTAVTYDVREMTPGGRSLIATELAVNTTLGPRVIPACPEYCSYADVGFSPNLIDVGVGNTDTVAIDGVNQCNGDATVLTQVFSSWSSQNASIARVTKGQVQGVAPGSTTAYAYGLVDVPGECACNLQDEEVQAPVTVVGVTAVNPSNLVLGTGQPPLALGAMTISGVGFESLLGQVAVRFDGGVTASNVVVQNDSTITATYSVPCSVDVGIQNLLVGATLDGGLFGSAPFPVNVVLPAVSAPTIQMGGQSISGTQSVVVGQQIALTASYSIPPCMSLDSQQWSTPSGTANGGFSPSNTSGSVTDLPVNTNSSYTFYWVAPENSLNMTYQYVLAGGGDYADSPVATATFDVSGPNCFHHEHSDWIRWHLRSKWCSSLGLWSNWDSVQPNCYDSVGKRAVQVGTVHHE